MLSQGERQQTLVARARMVDPLLIVLDEPCAGMDPGVRERFLHWLNGVAGEVASATGPALVFVTHHVEEIMPAFMRTLIMERGRIAADGATREIVTAERLAAIYGVSVERVERHAERLWAIWGESLPRQ